MALKRRDTVATSKKEMIKLIEKMSETVAATQWFRARNDELRECLKHISVSATRYDSVGGHSGPGDSTGQKVLKRADIEEEIKINERAIRDRLSHHSQLSRVMAEALDQDERAVIWARYGDRLPWDRVARAAKKARTACFRIEKEGMEKLCIAWDLKHEEKRSSRD